MGENAENQRLSYVIRAAKTSSLPGQQDTRQRVLPEVEHAPGSIVLPVVEERGVRGYSEEEQRRRHYVKNKERNYVYGALTPLTTPPPTLDLLHLPPPYQLPPVQPPRRSLQLQVERSPGCGFYSQHPLCRRGLAQPGLFPRPDVLPQH